MLDLDWLGAMRRVVEAQRKLFEDEATIAERTVYEGIGEGGDRTLAIDRRCEDMVFAELEGLHSAGAAFTAISEERGQVDFGEGAAWRVVVDPIDGSLNARRTIPSHCLSVAVASGPSMADVEWGFVHDFGSDEEYVARRGAGTELNGKSIRAEGPGFGLEVVGIESADPRRIAPVMENLAGTAFRVRVVGSIAITLCWVAAGRLDGMLSARPCRSVDAAAAQLLVTEAGGVVEFADHRLEDAPLDLDARYAVLGAPDSDSLAAMREAQAVAPRD